jgi:uncharacterized Zn finger protein
MCKHVAAALYGTAVRLDQKPELFFVLRGVQISSFVGEVVNHETRKLLKTAEARSERVLRGDEEELSRLFGIVMEEKTAGEFPQPSPKSPLAVNKRSRPPGSAPKNLKSRKKEKTRFSRARSRRSLKAAIVKIPSHRRVSIMSRRVE